MMKQQQEPKLSNGRRLSAEEADALAVAAIQSALDTLDTANVPDTAGVPLAADEPREDPGKLYGVQVCGVVDPLIEHIDRSVEKWLRMRAALVARRELLVQAARENAEFVHGATEQLNTVDTFIDQLTDDFEASVPMLPLAKAA